ncbi:MAG TPA: hypothetical protein VK203_29460 [Nostocaceae cyanobacterium]|nr:hypothetical protein [Nostocaceae cyanobacterium]
MKIKKRWRNAHRRRSPPDIFPQQWRSLLTKPSLNRKCYYI